MYSKIYTWKTLFYRYLTIARILHIHNIKMGVIERSKKAVMIVVRLFSNACGEKIDEQIGEQIGGEQITVLLYTHSRIP